MKLLRALLIITCLGMHALLSAFSFRLLSDVKNNNRYNVFVMWQKADGNLRKFLTSISPTQSKTITNPVNTIPFQDGSIARVKIEDMNDASISVSFNARDQHTYIMSLDNQKLEILELPQSYRLKSN